MAAASEGQSTGNSSDEHRQHFFKCLRLWDAMLPRKQGDDLASELMARAYYRMLGHLSQDEISALTEMVLDRCRWFPTVAEVRDMMREPSYHNPFYITHRRRELDRLGYTGTSPVLQIEHKDDTDAQA